jgi:hypothetical protein
MSLIVHWKLRNIDQLTVDIVVQLQQKKSIVIGGIPGVYTHEFQLTFITCGKYVSKY